MNKIEYIKNGKDFIGLKINGVMIDMIDKIEISQSVETGPLTTIKLELITDNFIVTDKAINDSKEQWKEVLKNEK